MVLVAGVLKIFYKSGFLIFLIMAFILQRPETLVFGGVLCAVYAISRANFFNIRWNGFPAALFVVLACSFAVLGFNHGLSPIFYLFSTFSAFYAAKYFNESSLRDVSRCLEVVFWLAILAIGWVLLSYWDYPEPFGEVITGSSTNGIPSYLIVLQIALSLAVFLERGRLPILSPIFTVIVAVFGLGRGSMVVAGMILILSVFINFSLKEMTIVTRLRILLFYALAGFLALVVLGLYFDYGLLFDDLIGQSKFSEGLLDPYRGEILEEYLGRLNFFSFLFGLDYSGTIIESRYDGNPHIAYVRTHAYYGFFGLLFVFLSPLLIVLSNKKPLYKFIFLSFILLALIRALSEPLFFPTLLDFFYFLYFFMFFKYSPSSDLKSS